MSSCTWIVGPEADDGVSSVRDHDGVLPGWVVEVPPQLSLLIHLLDHVTIQRRIHLNSNGQLTLKITYAQSVELILTF